MFDAPALLARAKGGEPGRQRAQNYLRYGYPLALALAVDLGVQTIARIILATQAGEAELGAYAAAFGLARPLDLMFMSAGAALAPALLAAYEEHGADIARDIARRNFEIMAAFAFPVAVGLALVAQPLSALLVGETLAAHAALVLPWLALAGLFTGFSLYYWSEAFQLARRTGERAAIMLAPALLQLALTLPLTRMYGATGAAMAAAAAALASVVLLAVNGRAHVALPLPLAALGRIVLATLTMAMVVVSLPMHDVIGLGFAITLGAGAYFVTGIALDVLETHAAAAHIAETLRAKVRALLPRVDRSHAGS
jgi:O-antigen/teichoic acid export membrane protein